MTFHHGIKTNEKNNGIRPVRVFDYSAIGVIGTAPDAASATAAVLAVGTGTSAFTVTAGAAGTPGNAITLELRDPGANSAALAVAVVDSAITVTLETDGTGVLVTTAAEIVTAINGDGAASALVTAALPAGSGAGVVRKFQAARALSGGAAEPFPLNTPVLIAGSRAEAAGLGTTGDLPAAVDGIFDQIGARIVVIRVAEGLNAAETMANVIGGIDGAGENTGLQALLDARSKTGVVPKLLIAPGYSANVAVTTEMVAIAARLRAVYVADGPNTTDADAIAFRDNFGSQRIAVIDPWVTVFDTATQTEIAQPPSARVAGMCAKVDAEYGFPWWPSNTVMNGITGTTRPVSFALNDPNTRANLLNAAEVTTIVQDRGWRLWGNRSTTEDQLWAFLAVRRIQDMVLESIENAHLWAIDQPFSGQLLRDIQDSIDAFLRELVARGAILGGSVWIDPELNTPATLKAGRLYINVDCEPPAPLELLTINSYRNDGYYSDLITDFAQAA